MAKFKTNRTTFSGLKSFLGNRSVKKLAHNTLVHDHETFVTVTLHGHEIVRLDHDGTMFFSDCGYQTVTTKERLNHFISVYQKNWSWYIGALEVLMDSKNIYCILPDGSTQVILKQYYNTELSDV